MIDENLETRYLALAVEAIGSCLTDLARLQLQGLRPENQAMRGGIAAGLERAAAYVRGEAFRSQDGEGS